MTLRPGPAAVGSLENAAQLRAAAEAADASDPLARCRELFVPAGAPGELGAVVAYLDGNSLGRPLRATQERVADLVAGDWGTRLIRSWDEQWMDLPLTLGDRLGSVVLGAAAGQTVVADSTTVLLYKLLRAAVAAAPAERTEIVLDTGNFPTDRYVAEGVAAETGSTLVWVQPDPAGGVTPEQVAEVVGERTALVLLSHVAYTSAWVADLPAITAIAHDAGALVLWDLCHSAGALPVDLDAHDVDLAVGCTYKYLNGGPGAPAFAYVAERHQEHLVQPIQGWMGHEAPFVMGPGYRPSPGMRRWISGTPPVLGMVGIADTVDLVEQVGLDAIRAKGVALGELVVAAVDGMLARHGVTIGSPRDPARRGNHVTLTHPEARDLCARLWADGVIPDFREPAAIRLGLAPLSTSLRRGRRGARPARAAACLTGATAPTSAAERRRRLQRVLDHGDVLRARVDQVEVMGAGDDPGEPTAGHGVVHRHRGVITAVDAQGHLRAGSPAERAEPVGDLEARQRVEVGLRVVAEPVGDRPVAEALGQGPREVGDRGQGDDRHRRQTGAQRPPQHEEATGGVTGPDRGSPVGARREVGVERDDVGERLLRPPGRPAVLGQVDVPPLPGEVPGQRPQMRPVDTWPEEAPVDEHETPLGPVPVGLEHLLGLVAVPGRGAGDRAHPLQPGQRLVLGPRGPSLVHRATPFSCRG